METSYQSVVRLTQADAIGTIGQNLENVVIHIIDSNGVATGVIMQSGAAGSTPSTSGGGGSSVITNWTASTALDAGKIVIATANIGGFIIGEYISSNTSRTTGTIFNTSEAGNFTSVPEDTTILKTSEVINDLTTGGATKVASAETVKTLKTQQTDSTVDAFLKTLKTEAVIIVPVSTDINTLLENGTYNGFSLVNAPTSGAGHSYYIEVLRHRQQTGVANSDWVLQKATRLELTDGVVRHFMRIKQNTAWSTWKAVTLDVTQTTVNNTLTSTSTTEALSAAQGKALKDTADALATTVGLKEVLANKNTANGYAGLDAGGKVAAAQLPSYVDDVIEAANLTALPVTGETGKIYVAIDTNKPYRWSGTVYVEISPSPGSTDAVTEGATNLYFTTARARTVSVADAIVDGVVDVAPSQNAVFDALALKITDGPTTVTNAHLQAGSVTNAKIATAGVGPGKIADNVVGSAQMADNSVTPAKLNTATQALFTAKQDTLVSGTNIKTINSQSILGAGDIPVGASSASITTRDGGTGGIITQAGNDRVHTFNASDNFTVPAGVTSVQVLAVAGGGGGGTGRYNGDTTGRPGGGGGAGGYISNTNFTVTPGATIAVTVGAGGAGATDASDALAGVRGTQGGNSVFSTLTAIGGGGGGGHYAAMQGGLWTASPTSGGSGGGDSNAGTGGAAGTAGQGNAGGNSSNVAGGGGGGGAGGVGGNEAGGGGGGGAGLANTITGSSVTYAAGGAGATSANGGAGANGTTNRGNGGAGASKSGSDGVAVGAAPGGNGGSGVVIVRYIYQSIDTPIYANNAAAISGGLTLGMLYRTGADPDVLCVVH